MRLIFFTAKNFRRFAESTSVKLHGDLIALIGPNEAGKSSILDALALLASDEPFVRSDQPRRSGNAPELSWGFQLDPDDRSALAEIPQGKSVRRVVVTKHADGRRRWKFEPSQPVRDRKSRRILTDLIEKFLSSDLIDVLPRAEEDDFRDRLSDVLEALQADPANMSADAVNALGLASASVETLNLDSATEETDENDEEATKQRGDVLVLRDDLAQALNVQAHRESEPHPATRARTALEGRLPSMILYGQLDRDLRGSYALEEVAADPPQALRHLISLADLDLVELHREIQEGLSADVATRRDRANRTLLKAFDTSWNQQKVALQIHLDGLTLFIHATSLDAIDAGMSELGERSDGLRWFASLLAFVHGWTQKPILLVDEIETHLHYDAQADLVNFLGRQEFTAKVIYTTHSFGCLPPDIGNGIRLVEPVDEITSRLANGFWRNGVGFSPLLASMGAAAVSFTPSRHAVIVEGPSDAILLPTLMRQAGDSEDRLDFQIVPGVAEVAAARLKGLTAEAGRVIFVVDGNGGGTENKRKLIGGGVDEQDVVLLSDDAKEPVVPLETEDLIDADAYVAAVNEELSCWNDGPPEVTASELGNSLRTKTLKAWCAKNALPFPDKIAVAERVIEASSETPVYNVERRDILRKLRSDLVRLLNLS